LSAELLRRAGRIVSRSGEPPADAVTVVLSWTRRSSRPLLREGTTVIWGVLDQALLSATNFVTFVLIARSLLPSDFGWFVLLYSCLLFANNVQYAVITQPLNVLGATAPAEGYGAYVSTTALSQIVFATAWAVIAIVGWLVSLL